MFEHITLNSTPYRRQYALAKYAQNEPGSTPTHSGAGTKTHSGAGTKTHSGAGMKTRSGAGTKTRSGAGTKTRSDAGTDLSTYLDSLSMLLKQIPQEYWNILLGTTIVGGLGGLSALLQPPSKRNVLSRMLTGGLLGGGGVALWQLLQSTSAKPPPTPPTERDRKYRDNIVEKSTVLEDGKRRRLSVREQLTRPFTHPSTAPGSSIYHKPPPASEYILPDLAAAGVGGTMLYQRTMPFGRRGTLETEAAQALNKVVTQAQRDLAAAQLQLHANRSSANQAEVNRLQGKLNDIRRAVNKYRNTRMTHWNAARELRGFTKLFGRQNPHKMTIDDTEWWNAVNEIRKVRFPDRFSRFRYRYVTPAAAAIGTELLGRFIQDLWAGNPYGMSRSEMNRAIADWNARHNSQ